MCHTISLTNTRDCKWPAMISEPQNVSGQFIEFSFSFVRSEYGAFWKCIQAGGIYVFTQLCKMLALATFFSDSVANSDELNLFGVSIACNWRCWVPCVHVSVLSFDDVYRSSCGAALILLIWLAFTLCCLASRAKDTANWSRPVWDGPQPKWFCREACYCGLVPVELNSVGFIYKNVWNRIFLW